MRVERLKLTRMQETRGVGFKDLKSLESMKRTELKIVDIVR